MSNQEEQARNGQPIDHSGPLDSTLSLESRTAPGSFHSLSDQLFQLVDHLGDRHAASRAVEVGELWLDPPLEMGLHSYGVYQIGEL